MGAALLTWSDYPRSLRGRITSRTPPLTITLHYLMITKVTKSMKLIKISAPTTKRVWMAVVTLLTAAPVLACSSIQTKPTTVAQGASCGTLAEGDQLLGMLYAPGAIYSAKPIEKRIFKARANQPIRTMGATLYIKALPEMNAPYVQRLLSCHAASPENAHPNDPIHPSSGPIASLDVREAKHGFAVEVMANDPKVGEEIWKRAESLANYKGAVPNKQAGASRPNTTHSL